MTNRNRLYRTFGRLLLAAAALLPLAAGSCADDETPQTDNGQALAVSAYALESAVTRADDDPDDPYYPDYGPVTSGIYYLSYPAVGATNRALAKVEFGLEGYTEGYGHPTTMPGDGTLTWKNITSGSTQKMQLFNVSPEKHKSYQVENPYPSNDELIFRADESQFVAGRYIPYNKEHTNDILWGSKTQTRDNRYLSFELNHRMARVRVIVETSPAEGSIEELDLTKARVDITHIVRKPYSFSFANGTVSLKTPFESNDFDSINLLNTLPKELGAQLAGSDAQWAKIVEKDPESELHPMEYTTWDVLLPPQALREDSSRPRLVITVPDDTKSRGVRSYSGPLPHVMYDKDENPLTLEFLSGYLLTIRTIITSDPPEMSFLPVKVVEWVDKGEYDLTGKQAGIYSEEDLKQIIEIYNQNPENTAQLEPFGYLDKDGWHFNMFTTLKLKKADYAGKMPVKTPDYGFNFLGQRKVIFQGETDDEVETYKGTAGARQLKNLLSGDSGASNGDPSQGGE